MFVKSYRSSFEMKLLNLLMLILLPVLAHGWELVVGTENGLSFLNGSNSHYEERSSGANRFFRRTTVVALIVDTTNRRVFVGMSQSPENVLVATLSLDSLDANPVALIKKGHGANLVSGLAYDQYGDSLYWTDETKRTISWIHVEEAVKGQDPKLIYKFTPTEHPSGIAVDACRRLLFWTNDKKQAPTIERSRLDGSGRQVIISTDLYMPNAITVDPSSEGRLFWADDNEAIYYKIEMSHLDGSGRTTLVQGYHQKPFALYYAPSTDSRVSAALFWSEWKHNAVWQINLDGKQGQLIRAHNISDTTVMGLAAVESFNTSQPTNCSVLEETVTSISSLETLTGLSTESLIDLPVTSELQPLVKPLGSYSDQSEIQPTVQPSSMKSPVKPLSEVSVVTLEESSLSPVTDTERTNINNDRESNSVRLRANRGYCLNGELVDRDQRGVHCRCFPGYAGHQCEKSVCDNYCIHGSCSFEKRADGRWEAKCMCRLGFSGDRCEHDPCRGYCLNGAECKIEDNGQPKCTCPGNGQLMWGERCERFPNILQKMCALLSSQDPTKAVNFMPLESKGSDDASDGLLCLCPSSSGKYVYSSSMQRGDSNATREGERSLDVIYNTPMFLVPVSLCIALVAISSYLACRVFKLRRLPRIKKRIIVSKGSIPLASGCGGGRGKSPSPGSAVLEEQQQCEITIENCCNMNICETPCFEPQLRSPGKSGASKKTTKEEKKVLLVNMEVPKKSCGPCPGADELY